MITSDLRWRKSSRSGQEANCVELARDTAGRLAALRDSKAAPGPMLTAGLDSLLAAVRTGRIG